MIHIENFSPCTQYTAQFVTICAQRNIEDRNPIALTRIDPIKQFDIPLYSGTPSDPINFDQSGLVVLGCNIHDQMRGYILVVDSPFFGVSDDSGNLEVSLDQPGNYMLSLWHPEQEEQLDPIEISIGSDLKYTSSVQINTANLFLPRRGSSSGGYF